jgi:WD40 repeat protein
MSARFLAVTRDDGSLELWEILKRRLTLSIDAGRQSQMSVDEESGVMALLADDGEVSLWDTNSARPLASFRLEEPVGDKYGDIGYKSALMVSSPGPDLYAVTSGGFAYRFRLAPRALVEAACRLAGRDFSTQERKTYLTPIVPSGPTCT